MAQRPSTPEDFSFLGANFVKHHSRPILQIGNRVWTRYDLGLIGASHTQSAKTLDGIVQQLEIKTVKQLADRFADIMHLRGCRTTMAYVIGALLRADGISASVSYGETVTVDSLKDRYRKRGELMSVSTMRRSLRKGA